MRPLDKPVDDRNEIDDAFAWHDGNARAAITTLLADCAYLRWQVELAGRAYSRGFVRGWRPQTDRE